MAKTEFGVNDPLSNKLWSKTLLSEAVEESYIGRFIGKSKDSLIYRQDELSKNAGDRIRIGLRMRLDGDGVQGDAPVEGYEEDLTRYYDDLLINQLRHGTRSAGQMSEQRVPYDMRAEGKDALKEWWTDRFDTAFFNQICGYTPQTDTKYTGNNAALSATSTHIIRVGNGGDDASLSNAADNKFTLSVVDACVALAPTLHQLNGEPMIRPIMLGGEKKYVMFLHDYQVRDMRTSTTTGQWLDIQKAATSGGERYKSDIFTGAIGEYNGVILHKATRVTPGVANAGTTVANTRRAVFCGAQSATIAFGSRNGIDKMTWKEEYFDYENQLGIVAGAIFGLKKMQFNSKDFGTIIVPTYAAS
jgi:N4-gp56 family major capsid protein